MVLIYNVSHSFEIWRESLAVGTYNTESKTNVQSVYRGRVDPVVEFEEYIIHNRIKIQNTSIFDRTSRKEIQMMNVMICCCFAWIHTLFMVRDRLLSWLMLFLFQSASINKYKPKHICITMRV